MKSGKIAMAALNGDISQVNDLKKELSMFAGEQLFDWISNTSLDIIHENMQRAFPQGVQPEDYKRILKFILIHIESAE